MIRLGSTGLFIGPRHERPRLSRTETLEMLRRSVADAPTLYGLRALMGRPVTAQASRAEDEQMLEELAGQIESGDLMLFGKLIPVFPGSAGGKPDGGDQAPPPRPQTSRPARTTEAQTDPPLFAPTEDLAALAFTLQNAAQSGAPLCDH